MNTRSKTAPIAIPDILKTEISGWYRGPVLAPPGVEIHAICHPPEGACGDYIGVYHLGRGRLAIAIADATGHGSAASEILGQVEAVEDEIDLRQTSPAQFLATASHFLMGGDRLRNGQFITAALVMLDIDAGFAKVALAGHPPPLLIRDGHEVEHAWSRGMPLGIRADPGAPDNDIQLRSGDRLVLYTDGIPDAALIGGDWDRARSMLCEASGHRIPEAVLLAQLGGYLSDDWTRDDSSAVFVRLSDRHA